MPRRYRASEDIARTAVDRAFCTRPASTHRPVLPVAPPVPPPTLPVGPDPAGAELPLFIGLDPFAAVGELVDPVVPVPLEPIDPDEPAPALVPALVPALLPASPALPPRPHHHHRHHRQLPLQRRELQLWQQRSANVIC